MDQTATRLCSSSATKDTLSASIPPPPEPKKATKRRFSYVAFDGEAGPSHTKKRVAPTALADSRDGEVKVKVKVKVKGKVKEKEKGKAKAKYNAATGPSLAGDEAQDLVRHMDHLNKQHRAACDEIANLQYLLQQTEDDCRERELGVRQELLFQKMVERDTLTKSLQSERTRWARLVSSYRAEHQRELTRINEAHDKQVDLERKSFETRMRHLSDEVHRSERENSTLLANFQTAQTDLESANSLLRTAESDLSDLRRIESEDMAERVEARKGMPPSYESLSDPKGYLPAYTAHPHQDGGKFDLETVTAIVRNRFKRSLQDATVHALKLREDRLRTSAAAPGPALFTAGWDALMISCVSLAKIVDKVMDIARGGKYGASKRHNARDSRHHVIHVCDTLARLIIDLAWDVVAAMELRGYSASVLDSRARARNGMHFQQIDETLLKTLKLRVESTVIEELRPRVESAAPRCNSCGSSYCGGYCERLHAVSYYFTTVKQVCRKIDDLVSRDRQGTHFSDTTGWLADTLETERAQAANTAPARVRQPSPTPVLNDAEMEAAMRNSQLQNEHDVPRARRRVSEMHPPMDDDEDLPPTARQSFRSEPGNAGATLGPPTPVGNNGPSEGQNEQLDRILSIRSSQNYRVDVPAPRRSARSASRSRPNYAEWDSGTEGEGRRTGSNRFTRNSSRRRPSVSRPRAATATSGSQSRPMRTAGPSRA